jgi:hypothetical protein
MKGNIYRTSSNPFTKYHWREEEEADEGESVRRRQSERETAEKRQREQGRNGRTHNRVEDPRSIHNVVLEQHLREVSLSDIHCGL